MSNSAALKNIGSTATKVLQAFQQNSLEQLSLDVGEKRAALDEAAQLINDGCELSDTDFAQIQLVVAKSTGLLLTRDMLGELEGETKSGARLSRKLANFMATSVTDIALQDMTRDMATLLWQQAGQSWEKNSGQFDYDQRNINGSQKLGANSVLLTQMAALQAAKDIELSSKPVIDSSVKRTSCDSSVEIELTMSNAVLDILTTVDGKVSGLLGDLPLPEGFEGTLHESQKSLCSDLKDLPWESLRPDQQRTLLKYRTQHKKSGFTADRKIPGVKVKDLIQLRFQEETTFLGQKYPPGKHEVDLSDIFGKVEYRSEGDVKSVSGVELHFRSNLGAGTLGKDAWNFLEALGLPASHLHVHSVANVPLDELKENPATKPVQMANFLRLSEMAMEMLTIVNDGGNLHTAGKGSVVSAGPLRSERVGQAAEYFMQVAEGDRPQLGDRLKMGWVGARGLDTYDQEGIWGLEFRSIMDKADYPGDPNLVFKAMDAIKFKMEKQDYCLDDERTEKWLQHMGDPGRRKIGQLVGELHFHQMPRSLFARCPEHIELTREQKKHFEEMFVDDRKYIDLKMVLHDWSNDPLFFDNPEAKEKIAQAQKKAVSQISSWQGDKNIHHREANKLMTQFLQDSGIYQSVMNAVGVEI